MKSDQECRGKQAEHDASGGLDDSDEWRLRWMAGWPDLRPPCIGKSRSPCVRIGKHRQVSNADLCFSVATTKLFFRISPYVSETALTTPTKLGAVILQAGHKDANA